MTVKDPLSSWPASAKYAAATLASACLWLGARAEAFGESASRWNAAADAVDAMKSEKRNDHELLVRIDERVAALLKAHEQNLSRSAMEDR